MNKKAALALSVIGIVILIAFPEAVTQGISEGLVNSAGLLIPSLFPFMVASSFVIRSGAYELTGKAGFWGLPACIVPTFILSIIGGFPVGAKCIRLLYENGSITARQAERMSCFCVCSGPAFLMTAVGTMLLHSMTAGIILYFSQVMSVILLGIVSGFFFESDGEEKRKSSVKASSDLIQAFILSCTDGVGAVMELTAMVSVFAMVIRVISVIGFNNPWIATILEVTAACKGMTEQGFALWQISFAAGFGGLCVHFQIFQILQNIGISKLRFELFRLANAVCSGLFTYLSCIFVNPSVQTFAISENTNAEISSASLAGAFSLVVMSGIFLLSLKNGSVKRAVR